MRASSDHTRTHTHTHSHVHTHLHTRTHTRTHKKITIVTHTTNTHVAGEDEDAVGALEDGAEEEEEGREASRLPSCHSTAFRRQFEVRFWLLLINCASIQLLNCSRSVPHIFEYM